jgi:hypothetical protein
MIQLLFALPRQLVRLHGLNFEQQELLLEWQLKQEEQMLLVQPYFWLLEP